MFTFRIRNRVQTLPHLQKSPNRSLDGTSNPRGEGRDGRAAQFVLRAKKENLLIYTDTCRRSFELARAPNRGKRSRFAPQESQIGALPRSMARAMAMRCFCPASDMVLNIARSKQGPRNVPPERREPPSPTSVSYLRQRNWTFERRRSNVQTADGRRPTRSPAL